MAKHIVVSFSRNNPITNGHEKLFKTVTSIAKKLKTTPKIHMSQTADKKKNPLTHDEKVKLARAMIPEIASYVSDDKKVRTIIDVFKKYSDENSELHIIAGSDRVPEYEVLANKYNGKDYTYSKITVHSAGQRDPDAEGTAGISGTKMRDFAINGDFKSFSTGAPTKAKEKDVREMFDIIRDRLGKLDEGTLNMTTESIVQELNELFIKALGKL